MAKYFEVDFRKGSFQDQTGRRTVTVTGSPEIKRGDSGTNPVTDNTYTTSEYFVLDIDAGDRIANIKLTDGIKQ